MTRPDPAPIRELFVTPEMADALRLDAQRMPQWQVSGAQAVDLDLLMTGALFPLKGFQSQADCDAVSQRRQLASGPFWPAPVALAVSEAFAEDIEPGRDIALTDDEGLLALMSVTDRWTGDEGFLLGGPVKGIRPSRAQQPEARPNALRRRFAGRDQVIALWGPDDWIAGQRDRLGDLPHFTLSQRAAPSPQEVLLQAIVARNCGATDLLIPAALANDPLLAAHRADIGIAIQTAP